MKKNKIIMIVGLFAVLSVGVVYALLSDSVSVTGTVGSGGTLDVEIVSAEVKSSAGVSDNTAVVSDDSNSVTIDIPTLQYPGATITYSIELENSGSVDALLTDITTEGLSDSGDLLISYTGITVDSTKLTSESGNSVSFDITVTWSEDSTTEFEDEDFSIVLDFEQSID